MSNVIQFLEAMGRNPAVHGASAADYAATVALLEIDGAQRRALLDRNAVALSGLLEGRTKMFCMIATPDERAPGDSPDQDDGFTPDEEEPVDPGRS